MAAIKAQVPIIPSSVSQYVQQGDIRTKTKFKIFVKVHSPISTKGLSEKDMPELIAKAQNIIADEILKLNLKYS